MRAATRWLAPAGGGANGEGKRDRGEPRPEPACPFCRARDAEVISLFGTQAMVLQYRCRACRSLFEANKYPDGDLAT